jgi:HK97 family phage major capsid protein
VFRDAKDRLESTAFAVGTGTTQPKGIVTELQLVTTSRVSAQTNAQFGAVDVFAMSNALPERYQPGASWVGPRWLFNLARQFQTPNVQYNFWTDLGAGIPDNMLGYPVYNASAITNAGGTTGLSTATASNDDILVIADLSQMYALVDRIGGLLFSDPMVRGSNNRPTAQWQFFYYWRVGGGATNTDAAEVASRLVPAGSQPDSARRRRAHSPLLTGSGKPAVSMRLGRG